MVISHAILSAFEYNSFLIISDMALLSEVMRWLIPDYADKFLPFMVRQSFDKPVLSEAEGLKGER